MLYFLEKAGKIAAVLGALPPHPGCPDPKLIFPLNLRVILSSCADFFGIVKLTTYTE